MKDYIEKVNWFKEFPDDGNNDGYIYGINYVDFEGEGDIIDCEWFVTEDERDEAIKKLTDVIILNND